MEYVSFSEVDDDGGGTYTVYLTYPQEKSHGEISDDLGSQVQR